MDTLQYTVMCWIIYFVGMFPAYYRSIGMATSDHELGKIPKDDIRIHAAFGALGSLPFFIVSLFLYVFNDNDRHFMKFKID